MPEEYLDENHFRVSKNSQGLRRMYPNPKLKSKELRSMNFFVDIVAIHGLGADAFETWTTTDDDGVMWIKDILPQEIKEEVIDQDSSEIRVFTFGYDASIFVQPALAQSKRLSNFAENLLNDLTQDTFRRSPEDSTRPIIFLCHSLGGLVVKQAITRAFASPDGSEYKSIYNSIKGIHFFSTPHDGADTKSWAEVLGRLSNSLGMESTSSAAKALTTWSAELIDLTQNFVHPVQEISVVSYYEGRAEPQGRIVVNEGSVKALQCKNHKISSLDATYREMCRFSDKEENHARTIFGYLQNQINDLYVVHMEK